MQLLPIPAADGLSESQKKNQHVYYIHGTQDDDASVLYE